MAEEKRWRRVKGGGGGGGGGLRRRLPRPFFPFPYQIFPFIITIIFLHFVIPFTTATFDFVVRPEFGERAGDLNVSTFAGQTAHLPCTVKHLAGKRVSWIRGRDLQVLSTGRITFSTDVRISVLPGANKFKSRTARSVRVQEEEEEKGEWAEEKEEEEEALRAQVEEEEEEEGRRIDKVTFNSPSTITPNHINPQIPSPAHHTTKNAAQRPLAKSHTQNDTHHHHDNTPPHRHPPTTPRMAQDLPHLQPRRRRALEWPTWRTGFFFHPQPHHYHEDDTVSGLGGSPSWYHRELARFNYEGGGGGRGNGRSYTSDTYTNPIAIYPQGPISQDSQGKGHAPGPNYIEGVWEPEDYTLQIKYTKSEDAGSYICQINTEPRSTQVVRLNVVNMRAEIVGSRELYVKAGTPVTLACKVNHGTLMPGFILWYKGDRLVEYDTSGGRITVTTEPTGVSHLLLRHAHPSDSANYTCSPSAGAPASLTLNVIVDERQAAMQQGNGAPPPSAPHRYLLPPTLAVLWGACGGLGKHVGGVGVVLVLGEALFPLNIPLPKLLSLPLLLLLFPLPLLAGICVVPNFRPQKKRNV